MKNNYLGISTSIFLLLLHFVSSAQNEVGKPFIHNYSPKEYDAETQNWTIVQDSRGIMYFGNNSGVLQYDGNSWRLTTVSNNLIVRALAIDAQGVIYVGSFNELGYLAPDTIGQLKYVSYIDKLSKTDKEFGYIRRVLVVNNLVYFFTLQKIFCLLPDQSIKVIPINTSSFLFQNNNSLYYNEIGKGLKKISDTVITNVNGGEVLGSEKIYALIPDNSKLIVGSQTTGISEFDLLTGKRENLPKYDDVNKFVTTKILYHGLRLFDNALAFATLQGGVAVLSPSSNLSFYNKNSGLQDDFILYAKEDNTSNFWLTLNYGISKVERNTPISIFDQSMGLEGKVYTIHRHDSALFVGTSKGVFKYTDNRFVPNTDVSLQAWCFLDYTTPNDKKVLLVGSAKGIFEIKDDKATPIKSQNTVFDMVVSPNDKNRVFFAAENGLGSVYYNNGKWVDDGNVSYIKHQIRNIVVDDNKTFWLLSLDNGLISLPLDKNNMPDSARMTLYDTTKGLTGMSNNRMAYTKGKLYIARGNQVLSFDQAIQRFVKTDIGLASLSDKSEIYQIQTSENGDMAVQIADNDEIWIETARYNSGKYVWQSAPLRRMPTMEIIASTGFYFDNDILWIGGSEGLFRFDTKKQKDTKTPYQAIIRKVTLGEDSLIFGGQFYEIINNRRVISSVQTKDLMPVLQHRYNSVTFYYAAPFFEEESAIVYSYLLEGQDKKWSNWSKENKKEYTNLYEGSYTFRVKARNIYKTESVEATYHFTVLPPWYRTWWAYLLYIAGVLLLIWLVVKYNTRRLLLRQQRLEQIITERTAEVVKQKHEIELKNATLEQQKEEILSIAENLQEANAAITQKNDVLLHQKAEIQAQSEKLEIYAKELEQLSIVASETDNAVMIMDAHGNFLWFNEGFTRLYGYTGEEFRSKYPTVFDASSNPDINKTIARCIETRQSVIYETSGTTKSGEELWVQTTITPILDQNNQIEKLVAIDADIRKLKQAEREIRIKNDQITGSIRYAQRIQRAILPIKSQVDAYFDNFILYRPKDIVSGDFYWFSTVEHDNRKMVFLVVADCTGHGVPGAFMSMIGSRLLSEIVNELHIYDTNQILEALDNSIYKALQQQESDNNDGMDISVCRIVEAPQGYEVQFSGAKNSAFYVDGASKNLVIMESDRRAIGGIRSRKENMPFAVHTYNLHKGDSLYLFSDGFVDQNNSQRKRLGTLLFKQLIIENQHLPIIEQQRILENALDSWREHEEQRDDITVWGIRLK